MATKIVAIGGGNIRTRGTSTIDREIIRLSGEKRPKLLFIPTASSDSIPYWQHSREYFGGFWKCALDLLWLIKSQPTQQGIAKKISWADIIYVGGRNTLMKMRLWRRLGIDKLLKRAWHRGTVLCGISAGSICWFASGHSDSMSFYHPRKWKYIPVKGLGLIEAIHCPHYNGRTLYIPRNPTSQSISGHDLADRPGWHRRQQLRHRVRR
jgi:dipeptidase E